MEHFDVLIVGAGLSGIGAGAHLKMECPNKSFAILEGRVAMGGTWDLFRYPGIRSGSDMYTLGYRFRPWNDPKAIADGLSILKYINDTAKEFKLNEKIRYDTRVKKANWSTADALWTVKTENRLENFFLKEIMFIEGMRDYRRIHTVSGKRIMTLQTFSEFEHQIPPQIVCRVHKSFMVALAHIESVEKKQIKINNQIIPISDTYRRKFFGLIDRLTGKP